MELSVAGGSKVKLSEKAFGVEYNEGLVHQVVTAYLAGGRSGTKRQKNRSDVRGGGAKPWRQKGTGRARAGTRSSPIWRSGGATFAARPRDFSQKINKKMYRTALRSIFSELARLERLKAIKTLSLKAPKTKELIAELAKLKLDNVLIIIAETDKNIELSARNIPHVTVRTVKALEPVSLVGHENVLITVDALKLVEEWLG